MILSVALFFVIGAIYWVTLIWLVLTKKDKWPRISATANAFIQLTLIFFAGYSIVSVEGALTGLLSPPIAFIFVVARLVKFGEFLAIPVLVALASSAMIYVMVSKWLPRIWNYRWAGASAVGVATFFVSSAWVADFRQREVLSSFNADCVQRYSFWHSLSIMGKEFQFDLHMKAYKDGELYGWSFRDMNVYRVPRDAAINIGVHVGDACEIFAVAPAKNQ